VGTKFDVVKHVDKNGLNDKKIAFVLFLRENESILIILVIQSMSVVLCYIAQQLAAYKIELSHFNELILRKNRFI
jgi:hypothetical protein